MIRPGTYVIEVTLSKWTPNQLEDLLTVLTEAGETDAVDELEGIVYGDSPVKEEDLTEEKGEQDNT